MVELIYCADGNRRFAQIAIDAGYRYGARLPARGLHFAPYMADQDWKRPNRTRYMAELEKHRPHMATVLDLERDEQLPEVLSWAEEAAQWVEVVIIVPKAQGIVAHLPRTVGGAEVRLGYSVPTSYGGTELPIWEFVGWPVHLLGGNPQNQMRIARYIDVRSADGNAAMLSARWGGEWCGGRWQRSDDRSADFPYRVFERSVHNIMAAWMEVPA